MCLCSPIPYSTSEGPFALNEIDAPAGPAESAWIVRACSVKKLFLSVYSANTTETMGGGT